MEPPPTCYWERENKVCYLNYVDYLKPDVFYILWCSFNINLIGCGFKLAPLHCM